MLDFGKVHAAKDAETATASIKAADSALVALSSATEDKETLKKLEAKLSAEELKAFRKLQGDSSNVESNAKREVYTAFKRIRGAVVNAIPDISPDAVENADLHTLRKLLASATEMYNKNPNAFPVKVTR